MQKQQQKSKKTNKNNKRPQQKPARNAGGAQTSSRSAPLAKSVKMKSQAPQMSRSSGSDAKVLISHREFLIDLTGADFTVNTVSINPGLTSAFPWLARLANSYEFYQFKYLAFDYVPLCGATDTGAIMMAMDYDAADAPPTFRQDMMNYHHAVQGSIWDQLRLTCDTKNLSKFGSQRYTRGGPVPPGKDVKTYDLGNLYVAAAAATATLKGSVYVSYAIELSTPHVSPYDPSDYSGRVVATGAGVSKGDPLFNKVVTTGDSGVLDTSQAAGNNAFIVKEPGEYLIEATYTGTGLTNTMPSFIPDSIFTTVTNLLAGAVENAILITGHALKIRTASYNQRVSVLIPAAWATLTGLSFRLAPYAQSLN